MIKDKIEDTRVDRTIILQMAVKAINDTAGYNGIIPMLLVFGAFLRMIYLDPPVLSIAQQATAIRKAMTEVTKL